MDVVAHQEDADALGLQLLDAGLDGLAEAGVARISWGPYPWYWAMERLTEEAKALYTKL